MPGLRGPTCTLRLIKPDDAAYVHGLRTNPLYNSHLSKVTGTVQDQRAWIEGYQAREAAIERVVLSIGVGFELSQRDLAKVDVLSLPMGPYLHDMEANKVICNVAAK